MDCTRHLEPVVSSYGCKEADRYLRRWVKDQEQACECVIGSYRPHMPDARKSRTGADDVLHWLEFNAKRGYRLAA